MTEYDRLLNKLIKLIGETYAGGRRYCTLVEMRELIEQQRAEIKQLRADAAYLATDVTGKGDPQ